MPFRAVFLMFGAFIVSCGFSHFIDAYTFADPVYRLGGFVKLITAVVSVGTVTMLVPLVPKALAMRSPEDLEVEIAQRTAQLAAANAALQDEIATRQRVQEEREELFVREQKARAEAEAANRTKDEFLATLSHELRTPLNAMLGWLHIMRTPTADDAMKSKGIDVLDRNTRAQAQLIDDLLDLSRIVTGKLVVEARELDPAEVVAGAVDGVRPAAAAKGITLETDLDAKAGPVFADPTRMQQIVWNLLSNAVKFTPRGGSVCVRLRRIDSRVEIVVQDTGQGINADVLPHIFERFRQGDSSTTRAHGGLGLGLAIVGHLVELHGGSVSATSEGEGKGATFVVRLPVPAVSRSAQGDASRDLVRLDGLRVLVVDDETDAREMVAQVIRNAGAVVVSAADAKEALALLDTDRPNIIVSDVSMPEMDGLTLLRELRRRPADRNGCVPAVALTAYGRPSDRLATLAAGFQAHSTKPIDPRELLALIRSLAVVGR